MRNFYLFKMMTLALFILMTVTIFTALMASGVLAAAGKPNLRLINPPAPACPKVPTYSPALKKSNPPAKFRKK